MCISLCSLESTTGCNRLGLDSGCPFPIFLLLDKALKDTLDLVLLSGYFDRFPSHQNGCEEEEDEEPVSAAVVALAESSEAEKQAVDPGPDRPLKLHRMNLCFGNTFAIERRRITFLKRFFPETELIKEFSEPIAVEMTEVCILVLEAVIFFSPLMPCGEF